MIAFSSCPPVVQPQAEGSHHGNRDKRHLNDELVVGHRRAVDPSQKWGQGHDHPAGELESRSKVTKEDGPLRP